MIFGLAGIVIGVFGTLIAQDYIKKHRVYEELMQIEEEEQKSEQVDSGFLSGDWSHTFLNESGLTYEEVEPKKRGPGRPKGSKNKKKASK